MIAEIIRMDKDLNFRPTPSIMLIPEFKHLWENVDNPEIYFAYIHLMLYPTSIYSNMTEGEKEKQIHADYPIDKNDPYFVIAYRKAEKLYETPLKRGFYSAKRAYESLIGSMEMISPENITHGRDGNYNDVASYLKNSKQYMDAYLEVENKYKEEISGWGERELGFDEDFDYNDQDVALQ